MGMKIYYAAHRGIVYEKRSCLRKKKGRGYPAFQENSVVCCYGTVIVKFASLLSFPTATPAAFSTTLILHLFFVFVMDGVHA